MTREKEGERDGKKDGKRRRRGEGKIERRRNVIMKAGKEGEGRGRKKKDVIGARKSIRRHRKKV